MKCASTAISDLLLGYIPLFTVYRGIAAALMAGFCRAVGIYRFGI